MEHAADVVRAAVDAGTVPGAVVLVRHRGKVVLQDAYGWASAGPEQREMTADIVFDLASLTKPLVAAGVALALTDRGALSLDEEVTGYLPELRRVRGEGVTFRRLLAHTSGLPGWRPLYVSASGPVEMLRAIGDLRLAARPGSRFEYSDLGFIALGIALERVAGTSLPELAADLIFLPCGLERTGYRPAFWTTDVAVTEEGNAFERRMAEWAGLQFDRWRTTFHPGEVNDGNAHYGLGGISGHAGLFSTADEVGTLGEMWLRGGSCAGSRVLSEAAVELATSNQLPAGDAPRGLGWDLAKTQGPTLEELGRADAGFFPPTESPWSPRSSGELLSSRAFGHTGFTGTSLWIDPRREVVAVLLTNATHPQVDLAKPVNAMRARFHNAVAATVSPAPGS